MPAIETRERAREHRELILKAWSAREPFPWNGRFEKYGQVNIWPRPIQQPHPPVWVPGGGTPGALRDSAAPAAPANGAGAISADEARAELAATEGR